MTALCPQFINAFMPQTLAFVLCFCQEKNGPRNACNASTGLNINRQLEVSIMSLNPIRAIPSDNQSETYEASPIRPIYSDDPALVGDLVPTILKRAVMAAWENGAINNLEAWWIIQREGLRHK